jgi:hypothetical protein
VSELAARTEVLRLARELGLPAERLAFLERAPATELAAFRKAITTAILAQAEPRLKRIASASRMIPRRMAARLAESQLGPLLSARLATVLDTTDALRLARTTKPAFLAEMSTYLDTERTRDLLAALPEQLMIDVGLRLLNEHRYATLGRLIFAVTPASLGVLITSASDLQLLEVAINSEHPESLDDILRGLSDDRARGVVAAAARTGRYDEALSLLSSLSDEQQVRLADLAVQLGPDVADGLVRAAVRLAAWDEVLPLLERVGDDTRRALVNVPTTLDPMVLTDVLTVMRRLDAGSFLLSLLTTLDGAHLATLGETKLADDPDVVEWLGASMSMPPAVVAAMLTALREARSTRSPYSPAEPPHPVQASRREHLGRSVRSARATVQRRRAAY